MVQTKNDAITQTITNFPKSYQSKASIKAGKEIDNQKKVY